jgi:hypothetical protein
MNIGLQYNTTQDLEQYTVFAVVGRVKPKHKLGDSQTNSKSVAQYGAGASAVHGGHHES